MGSNRVELTLPEDLNRRLEDYISKHYRAYITARGIKAELLRKALEEWLDGTRAEDLCPLRKEQASAIVSEVICAERHLPLAFGYGSEFLLISWLSSRPK